MKVSFFGLTTTYIHGEGVMPLILDDVIASLTLQSHIILKVVKDEPNSNLSSSCLLLKLVNLTITIANLYQHVAVQTCQMWKYK